MKTERKEVPGNAYPEEKEEVCKQGSAQKPGDRSLGWGVKNGLNVGTTKPNEDGGKKKKCPSI